MLCFADARTNQPRTGVFLGGFAPPWNASLGGLSPKNGRVAAVFCLGTWRFWGFSMEFGQTRPKPGPTKSRFRHTDLTRGRHAAPYCWAQRPEDSLVPQTRTPTKKGQEKKRKRRKGETTCSPPRKPRHHLTTKTAALGCPTAEITPPTNTPPLAFSWRATSASKAVPLVAQAGPRQYLRPSHSAA